MEKQKKRFYTTTEASVFFDGLISAKTLEKWRRLGKGPRHVDMDGIIAYRLEDLEKFVADGMKDPSSNFAA